MWVRYAQICGSKRILTGGVGEVEEELREVVVLRVWCLGLLESHKEMALEAGIVDSRQSHQTLGSRRLSPNEVVKHQLM